jgi:hypothetical protein
MTGIRISNCIWFSGLWKNDVNWYGIKYYFLKTTLDSTFTVAFRRPIRHIGTRHKTATIPLLITAKNCTDTRGVLRPMGVQGLAFSSRVNFTYKVIRWVAWKGLLLLSLGWWNLHIGVILKHIYWFSTKVGPIVVTGRGVTLPKIWKNRFWALIASQLQNFDLEAVERCWTDIIQSIWSRMSKLLTSLAWIHHESWRNTGFCLGRWALWFNTRR